jgi:hypothetical protein
LWAALILLVCVQHQTKAEIGSIRSIEGGSQVAVRRNTDNLNGIINFNLESNDVISTNSQTANLEFRDGTKVVVKDNSRLVIDNFVYDPNSRGGRLGMRVGLGTVRYASGQIAHSNPQSVDIQTPTAQIAVRGTDFNMTVDEVGRSLVVLVPSCDNNGNCVTGKIDVMTMAGTVTLEEAYTATFTSQATQAPIEPVRIQNITDRQINNLLIIAVPREVRAALDRQSRESREVEQVETQTVQQTQQSHQTVTAEPQVHRRLLSPRIIVENKQGNTHASRRSEDGNIADINFGSGQPNASVSIQFGQDQASTRLGNGLNTVTIRQSR